MYTRHWCYIVLLSFGLMACGGGGGGSAPVAIVETGLFLDSRVAGVTYKTETRSGITSVNGEYEYVAGETVTFSIGGITLGSATASGIVTPLSLVPGATDATNPMVTNIVKLLVSLDADNNPDNGLSIDQATLNAAETTVIDFNQSIVDFQTDSAVTGFMTGLGEALVSTNEAQTHFDGSMKSTWNLMSWDSSISNNSTWK